MPIYTVQELYDLTKSLAGDYLRAFQYPWQALAGISEYILQLGPTLPQDRFTRHKGDVWIANSATVAENAFIGGPCVIDEEAEVRHCAFIRGSAIVGKNAVVGNSTELKNVILFDGVQVPHFNYVGDSILGYKAHLGAGVITTNIKSDKSDIVLKADGEQMETKRRKIGTMAGDYVEVGCNSALAPGCILGKNVTVYPVSHVRHQVPESHIFKAQNAIVAKKIE